MRKRDLKEQIKTNRQTIDVLVRQNDLLTLAGNEQRVMLQEANQQVKVYQRAWELAAGRLAAHNGFSPDDASTFAYELLQEAIQSL